MNRVTLLVYRLVYGASSALIFAGALTEVIHYWEVSARSQTLLLFLFTCTAAFPLFGAFIFRRATAQFLWIGILLFCGFFAWYAWYSLPAPFVQHEQHALGSAQAASENSRFRLKAEVTYGIIVFWFVTLPLARQFLAKREARTD